MDDKKTLLNDMFGNPVGECHGIGSLPVDGTKKPAPQAKQKPMNFHMGVELERREEDTTPVKEEDLCPHF